MREFQCHSSCHQIKSVDLLPGHCDINDTVVIPFFWEVCGWRSNTLDHCSYVVIEGKIAFLKFWEIAAPSVIDFLCVHGVRLQPALAALRVTPRHHQTYLVISQQPHLVISQQPGASAVCLARCSRSSAVPSIPAVNGPGAVPALASQLSPGQGHVTFSLCCSGNEQLALPFQRDKLSADSEGKAPVPSRERS